jgi:hypothetical protein
MGIGEARTPQAGLVRQRPENQAVPPSVQQLGASLRYQEDLKLRDPGGVSMSQEKVR